MRSRPSRSARFADSCASCEWRCERCRALTADVDDEMEFVAELEGRGLLDIILAVVLFNHESCLWKVD